MIEEEKKELTSEEITQLENQQKFIEYLKETNPRAYFKLVTGNNYIPWERTDNNTKRKVYRNEKCACGSNEKTKYCCGIKTEYKIKTKVKEDNNGDLEIQEGKES